MGEVSVPVVGELLQRYGARESARGLEQLTRMITVRGKKLSEIGQWFGK